MRKSRSLLSPNTTKISGIGAMPVSQPITKIYECHWLIPFKSKTFSYILLYHIDPHPQRNTFAKYSPSNYYAQ